MLFTYYVIYKILAFIKNRTNNKPMYRKQAQFIIKTTTCTIKFSCFAYLNTLKSWHPNNKNKGPTIQQKF